MLLKGGQTSSLLDILSNSIPKPSQLYHQHNKTDVHKFSATALALATLVLNADAYYNCNRPAGKTVDWHATVDDTHPGGGGYNNICDCIATKVQIMNCSLGKTNDNGKEAWGTIVGCGLGGYSLPTDTKCAGFKITAPIVHA